jgi:hypothetical protein
MYSKISRRFSNNSADEQAHLEQQAKEARAALAAGAALRPAKPRTSPVQPKFAVDVDAWEEYFDSFDPFPEEVGV